MSALRADIEPPRYSNAQRSLLTLMMLTLSMLLVSWQLSSFELGAAFVLILSLLSAALWGRSVGFNIAQQAAGIRMGAPSMS